MLTKDPSYLAYLSQLEKEKGLPSGLLKAQMKAESSGNPRAVSPVGAMGAFQFMPATAKQYGIDPFDPIQAAKAAAQMNREMLNKYEGDLPSALAAYNWGQGNVDRKGLENMPTETRNYIAKISGMLGQPQTVTAQRSDSMTNAAIVGSDAPPLPEGFELLEDVPPLPEGFELLEDVPPLPEGFEVAEMPTSLSVSGADVLGAVAQDAARGLLGVADLPATIYEVPGALARPATPGAPFLENLAAAVERNPLAPKLGRLVDLTETQGTQQAREDNPVLAGIASGVGSGAPFGPMGALGGGLAGGAQAVADQLNAHPAISALAGIAASLAVPQQAPKSALAKTTKRFGGKVPKAAPSAPANPAMISDVLADVPGAELVANLTKKEGELIPKTAGQRLQDPKLQRIEASAIAGNITPQAELGAQAVRNIQNRTLKGLMEKVGGELEAGRDVNAIFDDVGATIKQQAGVAKEQVNSAYELAKSSGRGVKIGVPEIKAGLLAKITDIRKREQFDINNLPESKAVFNKLKEYTEETKGVRVTAVKLKELENFRTFATKKLMGTTNTVERLFIGKMIGEYDDFMKRTAADAVMEGDAEAIMAFRKAVASRAEFSRRFEKNQIVEGLAKGEMSVDDARNALIGSSGLKGRQQVVDNYKAMIRAAGDEGETVASDIRNAFIKDLYARSQAGYEAGTQNVMISFPQLQKNLDTLFNQQSALANQVFGKQNADMMRKAVKELDLINKKQPGVGNPSGTAGEFYRIIRPLLAITKAPGIQQVSDVAGASLKPMVQGAQQREVLKSLQGIAPKNADVLAPKSPIWYKPSASGGATAILTPTEEE